MLWTETLTWIQNYGVGVVVVAAIIFFITSWTHAVWMPALKQRSELKLEEEKVTSEINLETLRKKSEHEQQIRNAQLEEQRVKLELADTMVKTSEGMASVLSSVHHSLARHSEGLVKLSSGVGRLNEQHDGKHFETMTLKRKHLAEIEIKRNRGELTDDEARILSDCIKEGL